MNLVNSAHTKTDTQNLEASTRATTSSGKSYKLLFIPTLIIVIQNSPIDLLMKFDRH